MNRCVPLLFFCVIAVWYSSARGENSAGRLGGVCFSSIRDNESPERQISPLPSTIEEDVVFASHLASSIRTYTVDGTNALIPEYCNEHDVDCILGAWIGSSRWQNDAQMEHLIHLCGQNNSHIKAVIVGNEVLHRGDCDEAQLIEYVRLAKDKVSVPVAVADTWRSWLDHPRVAAEVDVCGVQIYPYWEGMSVVGAAEYTLKRLREVQEAYPKKRVVLTEFGWPTDGETLGSAEASPENAARYLREILPLLEDSGYEYYYFAIWDEKWKVGPEGGVGAHWGLFHSDGSIKPALKDLVPEIASMGSKRPPRRIAFAMPSDQGRNQQVRAIAIGPLNSKGGTSEAESSRQSLQRGAGLEVQAAGAVRSSYYGLRPIVAPDSTRDERVERTAEQVPDTRNTETGNTSAPNKVPNVESNDQSRSEGAFASRVHHTLVSTTERDERTPEQRLKTQSVDQSTRNRNDSEENLVGQKGRIVGVCLSLFRDNESPHFGINPLISELRGDVAYATKLARAVRTYSAADSFAL
ncbi:MAG: glycosyl hydrolase family 17 protein, partial [Planctomycetota bacterium]